MATYPPTALGTAARTNWIITMAMGWALDHGLVVAAMAAPVAGRGADGKAMVDLLMAIC